MQQLRLIAFAWGEREALNLSAISRFQYDQHCALSLRALVDSQFRQ
jgi:hypothetical protein